MPHYQVNRDRFTHNGQRKTFGDTVELSEQAAEPYLASEALLPLSDDFTPTEQSDGVVSVDDDMPGADGAATEHRLQHAGNQAQPGISILIGSDLQPAYIDINGEQVQLGTVVVRAFELSGITSADAWNTLDPQQREAFIDNAIGAMRAQATTTTPPPAAVAPTRSRRSRTK